VLKQAQAAGHMPSELERLISELVKPELDIADLLSRWIEKQAKNDYAWFPPNKRYLARDMILPSMTSNSLPDIAFFVDTSGSVDQEQLTEICSILEQTLTIFEVRIHVIFCDTAISSERGYMEITSQDLPLDLSDIPGGGGTDFRPPFEYIEQNNIDIACALYLTDLDCSRYPATAPDYPVMWIQTPNIWGGSIGTPPFGEVIKMRQSD
jgi:predicted metal-dependent peptidase